MKIQQVQNFALKKSGYANVNQTFTKNNYAQQQQTDLVSKNTAESIKNIASAQISFSGKARRVFTSYRSYPNVKPVIIEGDLKSFITIGGSHGGYSSHMIDMFSDNGQYLKKEDSIMAIIKNSPSYDGGVIEKVEKETNREKDSVDVYFLEKGEKLNPLIKEYYDYDYIVHPAE